MKNSRRVTLAALGVVLILPAAAAIVATGLLTNPTRARATTGIRNKGDCRRDH
jgi:hypothetical protein